MNKRARGIAWRGAGALAAVVTLHFIFKFAAVPPLVELISKDIKKSEGKKTELVKQRDAIRPDSVLHARFEEIHQKTVGPMLVECPGQTIDTPLELQVAVEVAMDEKKELIAKKDSLSKEIDGLGVNIDVRKDQQNGLEKPDKKIVGLFVLLVTAAFWFMAEIVARGAKSRNNAKANE